MPAPSEKRPDPESTEHDVDGHVVRIVTGPDHEELWIDGTRRRFFKNSGGYVLADNAYMPARETLLEAVRDYLRQSERERGGTGQDEQRGER
ncbi:hypothetical protein [Massilia sp. ZL223]|uniref:hypothetical protein n=1 Tax=Massilia sp. ZL223 TaxID=2824904 RepID=UPI001B82F4F6|nr:hypothetical protein [Massilia sp. ZL223]MBQ5964931.1 hypothetical protein [Massilia sp. ZL223]